MRRVSGSNTGSLFDLTEVIFRRPTTRPIETRASPPTSSEPSTITTLIQCRPYLPRTTQSNAVYRKHAGRKKRQAETNTRQMQHSTLSTSPSHHVKWYLPTRNELNHDKTKSTLAKKQTRRTNTPKAHLGHMLIKARSSRSTFPRLAALTARARTARSTPSTRSPSTRLARYGYSACYRMATGTYTFFTGLSLRPG